MDAQGLAPYLWICTALLVYRVAGQLIVATLAPSWLPPMERWQSGLVPYWFLLMSQAVVLYLMFSISIDFTRGRGYWVEPHASLGAIAYCWSYLYAAAMLVRSTTRMRRPIPIFFHTVVAAFQWTFGLFHVFRA
ncbi:MAG TPA: hypothetical protein VN700_10150 [Vicinamibacterales bacterium]|nr:hypothetical protein [Vicinamibacterales bacterium]